MPDKFNPVFEDPTIFDKIAKEQQDSASAMEQLSQVIDATSADNLRAIDAYAKASKNLNAAEGEGVDNLQKALDHYQELSNKSIGGKLMDAFASFADPSRSVSNAASNLRVEQQKLQLVNAKKAQVQDELATALKTSDIKTATAKTKVAKESMDVQNIKDQISLHQQALDEKLRLEQRALDTKSIPELQSDLKAGKFTQEQVDSQIAKRHIREQSIRNLDNSVLMGDKNVAERVRKDFLNVMPEHVAEQALQNAKDNNGIYQDPQHPNVWYKMDELQQHLNTLTSARTYDSAAAATLAKAQADVSTMSARLTKALGVDTGDLQPSEAYKVYAEQSQLLGPDGRKTAATISVLLKDMEDTPSARHKAELSKIVTGEIEKLDAQAQERLHEQFPEKNTKTAINQFWEEGQINELGGALSLVGNATIRQKSTGIPAYDRVLAGIGNLSSKINNSSLVDQPGWQKEFNDTIAAHADTLVGAAFTQDFTDAMTTVATKMQDTQMAANLQNQKSNFYTLDGHLDIDAVREYLIKKNPEQSEEVLQSFSSVLKDQIEVLAHKFYESSAIGSEGAVVKAGIDKMLFDNNAGQEFRNFANRAIRMRLMQPGFSLNQINMDPNSPYFGRYIVQ